MSSTLQGEARAPRKRPISVLVVAVAFIAMGLLDIWRGLTPLTGKPAHLAGDDVVVFSIGLIALIGSICVLRGHNWARWLLAAWMAFHVALSIQQPYVLLAHVVIFGLVVAGLFYPGASTYFRPHDG
jgi:hypothetical protein